MGFILVGWVCLIYELVFMFDIDCFLLEKDILEVFYIVIFITLDFFYF